MIYDNTLLIEIGTEELPPLDLNNLSLSFKELLGAGLTAAQFAFSSILAFATPRRLALQIFELAPIQPMQTISRKGPALKDALDPDGQPTKAALGFATSCGVAFGQLQQQETPKGICLAYETKLPGKTIQELLPEILTAALHALPIAKRMRWGSNKASFIRPVHWLVVLLNDQIIPCSIFNNIASNQTFGHRFHAPNAITLKHARDYKTSLTELGMVEPDYSARQANIIAQAKQIATTAAGFALLNNQQLLNLITAIVEYPTALLGKFDPSYLALPQEVLIAAMQEHQKCLPVTDNAGKLLPYFIIISNIKSTAPQEVVYGNELVMSARLADADFFFKLDQQQALENNLSKLQSITFQAKLGSLYDKVIRIAKLAGLIAAEINASPEITARAALLCKADLAAQMVYEFPELQGIMGQHYALLQGEDPAVASAIAEHYLPRFAQDQLPQQLPGICLAIADRIDTIVGLFAINKIPTGDKDPFALKRQSLAILRIIIEHKLPLDLAELINAAISNYTPAVQRPGILTELLEFFSERLRAWYLAAAGTPQVFAAVQAKQPTKPFDYYQRLLAVQSFLELPEAVSLAAANKRVSNILAKLSEPLADTPVDPKLFTSPVEHRLQQQLLQLANAIAPLLETKQYQIALANLAELQDPIDQFFNEVMVMDPNPAIRNNRLNLLQQLRALFLTVADLSLL